MKRKVAATELLNEINANARLSEQFYRGSVCQIIKIIRGILAKVIMPFIQHFAILMAIILIVPFTVVFIAFMAVNSIRKALIT